MQNYRIPARARTLCRSETHYNGRMEPPRQLHTPRCPPRGTLHTGARADGLSPTAIRRTRGERYRKVDKGLSVGRHARRVQVMQRRACWPDAPDEKRRVRYTSWAEAAAAEECAEEQSCSCRPMAMPTISAAACDARSTAAIASGLDHCRPRRRAGRGGRGGRGRIARFAVRVVGHIAKVVAAGARRPLARALAFMAPPRVVGNASAPNRRARETPRDGGGGGVGICGRDEGAEALGAVCDVVGHSFDRISDTASAAIASPSWRMDAPRAGEPSDRTEPSTGPVWSSSGWGFAGALPPTASSSPGFAGCPTPDSSSSRAVPTSLRLATIRPATTAAAATACAAASRAWSGTRIHE